MVSTDTHGCGSYMDHRSVALTCSSVIDGRPDRPSRAGRRHCRNVWCEWWSKTVHCSKARGSTSYQTNFPHQLWSTAPRSPQRTNVLYREPNSRHSKTSARAPDGLGQGVSGQPVLPATPPDHQIDRQRCDRASFQAGSPRSQPPLTVRISPHARSHVAWRITHYDQCVSYTRRVA